MQWIVKPINSIFLPWPMFLHFFGTMCSKGSSCFVHYNTNKYLTRKTVRSLPRQCISGRGEWRRFWTPVQERDPRLGAQVWRAWQIIMLSSPGKGSTPPVGGQSERLYCVGRLCNAPPADLGYRMEFLHLYSARCQSSKCMEKLFFGYIPRPRAIFPRKTYQKSL